MSLAQYYDVLKVEYNVAASNSSGEAQVCRVNINKRCRCTSVYRSVFSSPHMSASVPCLTSFYSYISGQKKAAAAAHGPAKKKVKSSTTTVKAASTVATQKVATQLSGSGAVPARGKSVTSD